MTQLPPLDDAWLVVIDPQRIFADPTSEWGSPMFEAALPQIKALRSGFNMHLSKPIDPAELLVVIETLVKSLA